jgi:hypothetical protein
MRSLLENRKRQVVGVAHQRTYLANPPSRTMFDRRPTRIRRDTESPKTRPKGCEENEDVDKSA